MYIHVYTRFCSSTRPLIAQRLAHGCTNCLTLLIPVTRLWRYSFSVWIGIWRLASRAFQSQSCLICTRKRLIFSTSCRNISLIRPGKRPNGILKKHTAFCTRSARLCFGATQITHHVKLQRYSHVVNMYVCYLYMYVQCIYMYIYSKYMLTTCVYNVYTCIYLPVLIFCPNACFPACPYRKHQNRGQPDE